MGGSAGIVDVETVRGGVDDDDLRPGGAQGGRAHVRGGPVGGVHDDAQAGQVGGHGVDEVVDVVLVRHGLALDDPADPSARGELVDRAEQGLDLVLDGVGELVAAAGEELDAIVLKGVVGGGDDHTQVHVLGRGQVGDGRGRQDAHAGDVHAGGGQAGRDGVVEELATGTGVTAHDGARSPAA